MPKIMAEALLLSSSFLILLFVLPNAQAFTEGNKPVNARKQRFRPGSWKEAHVTFYSGADGSGTMGGACGYEDLYKDGVPCKKRGVPSQNNRESDFNLISVLNVGGAGDVTKVEVRGDGSQNWTTLKRNWGQKWETDAKLVGQNLSFRITTSDGRTLISRNLSQNIGSLVRLLKARISDESSIALCA